MSGIFWTYFGFVHDVLHHWGISFGWMCGLFDWSYGWEGRFNWRRFRWETPPYERN